MVLCRAQLAKVEAPEADPESGDVPKFTSATVLESKWPSILFYFASFALVSAQFTTSLKITHRAIRMRRRAMIPFAIFLFATSLIPLGFILTQTYLGDPLAMTVFFVAVIVANVSGIALRCVLRPVMIQEYPMQDTIEGCENTGIVVGCLVLTALTWTLSSTNVQLGIVWIIFPLVLAVFSRNMPRCLRCCYPEQYAAATSYRLNFRRWYDDRARMSVFTDGVLAIAATFTLLEIRVPEPEVSAPAPVWNVSASVTDSSALSSTIPSGTFESYMLDHWADFAAYFDSFSVIVLLWVTHRDIGAALPRFGGMLRSMNMLCCMLAALIPFGMSLRESFPLEMLADMFALGVVIASSGALACMACAGRWLVRDPQGLPPLRLDVGEAEEEDEGGEGGGESRSRAGGAAARSLLGLAAGVPDSGRSEGHDSPIPESQLGSEEDLGEARGGEACSVPHIESQRSHGNDSYYGFLVEDDPVEDRKTDGRRVATAVQDLRRSAGYAGAGASRGAPRGFAMRPLAVMEESEEGEEQRRGREGRGIAARGLASDALFDEELEHARLAVTAPAESAASIPAARRSRQASDAALHGPSAAVPGGSHTVATPGPHSASAPVAEQLGDPSRAPLRASVAFRARETSVGSRSNGRVQKLGSGEQIGLASGQDLSVALLVPSGARGGYSANELPMEMEEHLVRLMVARALVLPLLAAVCALATGFVPVLGLNPLLLAWPLVGLVGWTEHSIRSPMTEPWALTRFFLCWRGRPRAIPGVGSVYPLHQGPCSWMHRCRRLRVLFFCDPSQDMDDRAAVTSRVAVSTAARAYSHGKDDVGDDDDGTTNGPSWGTWGAEREDLPQAASRGSLNGARDPMVTELTASSLR